MAKMARRLGRGVGGNAENRGVEVNELIPQLAPPIISGLLCFIAGRLWEKRRGLRFESYDWTFRFKMRDKIGTVHLEDIPDCTDRPLCPARYSFSFRIFNERLEAAGLHSFPSSSLGTPDTTRRFS